MLCALLFLLQATDPSSAGAGPLEAAAPSSPEVAATVNGEAIAASTVEERFQEIVARETRGRGLPAQELARARQELAPRILEELIDERLLDQEFAESGIEVPAGAFESAFEREVEDYLLREGLTRAEFAEQVELAEELPLEEFLEREASDPGFRRSIRHRRLLASLYPEKVKVSADEVSERYAADRETVFSRPERVRASHILIRPEEPGTGAEQEAALQEAERLATLARQPDADFAALAREHSADASSAAGGDLGFFRRDGGMVEPFAEAAFALEPGQVSDVVETRFGYHVIKVTGRKDAAVVPEEEAADVIRRQLKMAKLHELRAEHVAGLREGAEIEYSGS